MIKRLLVLVVVVSLLSSCGSTEEELVVANNVVRKLPVSHTCTELDVRGDWRVELNDSVQVPTVVVSENLMKFVTIDVNDWRVRLRNKPRMKYRMENSAVPCLLLPSENGFTDIEMSGATALVGKKLVGYEDLELNMSGTANFEVDTLSYVEDIDIDMSGATTLICKSAKMEELNVEMSGSAEAKMDVLGIEKEVDIEMSGASNMDLNCEVLELKMELSGSSKLNLRGRAVEMNASLSGSSSIDSVEEMEEVASNDIFIVDIAKVGIKGSSTIRFQCNDKLKVNASGNSYVLYRGSPKTMVKSTGASRVETM